MRSAVVVALLGVFWLGCAGADPSEVEPSSPQRSDESGGWVSSSPSGGSTGEMGERLFSEAYRHHHDPGPQEPGDDGEQTGAATAACWWWGPTPTGLIADAALPNVGE